LPASTENPQFPAVGDVADGSSHRVRAWLYRNRWLIVVVLAAFAVRIHWNLLVHPLGDYISSDMRGYTSRADQMLDKFGHRIEYHAFFPYGTHFLIAFLKLIFGRENYQAIGAVYALLGTIVVYYGYRIAERVSSRRWVPPLLGIFMVFYYPLIALGGYTLSEIPFAVFLLAASYALLRLVQDGKDRDAWMAGVHAAIATAFRPQILMSIVVFGVVWLLLRKHTKARLKHLVFAAIPIAGVLVYSSARLYHHTGRFGPGQRERPLQPAVRALSQQEGGGDPGGAGPRAHSFRAAAADPAREAGQDGAELVGAARPGDRGGAFVYGLHLGRHGAQ
jgi:4-amino-4-deoxy-L-arabinose transferase-like glycosyltransferase